MLRSSRGRPRRPRSFLGRPGPGRPGRRNAPPNRPRLRRRGCRRPRSGRCCGPSRSIGRCTLTGLSDSSVRRRRSRMLRPGRRRHCSPRSAPHLARCHGRPRRRPRKAPDRRARTSPPSTARRLGRPLHSLHSGGDRPRDLGSHPRKRPGPPRRRPRSGPGRTPGRGRRPCRTPHSSRRRPTRRRRRLNNRWCRARTHSGRIHPGRAPLARCTRPRAAPRAGVSGYARQGNYRFEHAPQGAHPNP
jgi:hypothetical protein